jgi:hypothetical protein
LGLRWRVTSRIMMNSVNGLFFAKRKMAVLR